MFFFPIFGVETQAWQNWTDEKLATKLTKDDRSRSSYYQPGGGLTRYQSFEEEDGGKGHARE